MRGFWRDLGALRLSARAGALLGAAALGAVSVTPGCARASAEQHNDTSETAAARDGKDASSSVELALRPAPPTPDVGPLRIAPIQVAALTHPLSGLDGAALRKLVVSDVETLGSASLGRPNRGWQVNSVRMPEGKLWKLAEPDLAWGTTETVEATQRAIERVESDHPGSPVLYVGHISRKRGGWLRPHRSHQSGRDVDLGYYYLDGPRWYARAEADNLDRPRTWALLLGLLAQGNVEYVFMSSPVQNLLLEYARAEGFDETWLASLFSEAKGAPEAIVRHRSGHQTHLHVRFFSDAACAVGEKMANAFPRSKRR